MTKKPMIYIARMPKSFGYGFTAEQAVRACLNHLPTSSTEPPEEPMTLDQLLNLRKVEADADWEISAMDGSLSVNKGEIEKVTLLDDEESETGAPYGEWDNLSDFLDNMLGTRKMMVVAELLPHLGLDKKRQVADAINDLDEVIQKVRL